MLTHHMLTSPSSTVLGTASAQGIDNKAHWNQADEVTLINYEHKSEAGGGASFKQEQFQAVSRILMECTKCGGPKTPTACRSKWTQVSSDPLSRTGFLIQLKSKWVKISQGKTL